MKNQSTRTLRKRMIVKVAIIVAKVKTRTSTSEGGLVKDSHLWHSTLTLKTGAELGL